MSFRQSKRDEHRRRREWVEWIGEHRATLRAIGLPAEVYLNESC